MFILSKLEFGSKLTIQRQTLQVTHLLSSRLWLFLTNKVRLWSLTWLMQASLQIEITGRGECLVRADSLHRLEIDHLHATIVTTPPQCSGEAMKWLKASQKGELCSHVHTATIFNVYYLPAGYSIVIFQYIQLRWRVLYHNQWLTKAAWLIDLFFLCY